MKQRIKKTFAVRNVGAFAIDTSCIHTYTPKAGDVGIFNVLSPMRNSVIGHDGIQVNVFEGDLIMAAFGARYATSQYEAAVPDQPVRFCHLVGRGGVAGLVESMNTTFKLLPMELELVGYATHDFGAVINVIDWKGLSFFNPNLTRKNKIILSIGSSMDSGKTTTAANLCCGLAKQGFSTAYIKLTGTAFPKDARFVFDRGAGFVCDFTLFGFPSTCSLSLSNLLDLYQSLVDYVCRQNDPEYIVIEIADGILQKETEMLLRDDSFMDTVHAVVFSCGDSLSAYSGVSLLNSWGIRPLALSGLFTSSELLIREVEAGTDIPVLRAADLISGEKIPSLLQQNLKMSATDSELISKQSLQPVGNFAA